MSFEELSAIAEENHKHGSYALNTLKMNTALRARLREAFPPYVSGAGSAEFTEALEMSAMRNGLPFMANLGGLTGIRIWLDDSLPENTWRLVDENGKIVKEGVVSE
jgi:hypothetical protein